MVKESVAMTALEMANNTDIYRVNRDGTGLTRLTDFAGFDGVPSWRPTTPQ